MTNQLNCKKTVIVFDKRVHYKGVSGGEQSYPIKIHKAQHTGKTVGSIRNRKNHTRHSIQGKRNIECEHCW